MWSFISVIIKRKERTVEHGLVGASWKVALSKMAAGLTRSGVITQSGYFSKVELAASPITGRCGLLETGWVVSGIGAGHFTLSLSEVME